MSGKDTIAYKLQLPHLVYEEIKEIADAEGTTVADVLRRAIKWEILANSVSSTNGAIYIRKTPDDELVRIAPLSYMTSGSSGRNSSK